MAKMFPAAPPAPHAESVEATLERIRSGPEGGLGDNTAPALDLMQRLEAEAEAGQSRDFGPFRLVLERHGFKFCRQMNPRPDGRVERIRGGVGVYGDWRHPSPALKMAWREIQVLALFLTAEDLDRWIIERKLTLRLERAREPKATVRKAMASLRRSS